MKKIILLIAFLFCAAIVHADEIHLKNGTVIRGKILTITPHAVEYKPVNDIPFDLVPRDQVVKVVYTGGKAIILNETPVIETIPQAKTDPQTDANRRNKSSPQAGVNQHDGFFFRFLMGGGSGTSIIQNADTIDPASGQTSQKNLSYKGEGTSVRMQFGYTILTDCILSFDFGSTSIDKPNKNSHTSTVASFNNPGSIEYFITGFGLTYYSMPINIYITASYGSFDTVDFSDKPSTEASRITVNHSVRNGHSLFMAIGKEWWVSNNWGLGAALVGELATAEITPKDSQKSYRIQNYYIGIAFSATYN